jgi:DNA/RNA-binding domain of Phe-tRNA-synthetase-like protein
MTSSAGATEAGITYPGAWVLSGVAPCLEQLDMSEPIQSLQDELRRSSTVPYSAGYEILLKELGYPDTVPAGMRLRQGIVERGMPQYGLLIDAVNVVSARHGAGIGLHDAQAGLGYRNSELHVWRADTNESIVPAFKDRARRIPEGDLVYGWRQNGEADLLAWLGKRDVDSAKHQIKESTQAALLVILGNSQTPEGYAAALCAQVIQLLRVHRPALQAYRLPVCRDRTE